MVVQKSSGLISIVQHGEIKRGLDAPKLRAANLAGARISPKREKAQNQQIAKRGF